MILDCDANATYAPDDRAKSLLHEALSILGNPSSLHRVGQRAKSALDDARDAIRSLVGACGTKISYRVIFTSGASESNNMIVSSFGKPGAHIVSSLVEHSCVLAPIKGWGPERGFSYSLVEPTPLGVIRPEAISAALTPATSLVSVMAANNETGGLNPIEEIAKITAARGRRIVVHSDAAQVIGKAPFSAADMGIDALTISGHKFGALPGVGALVVREDVALSPLLMGGAQEEKLRGGTENVVGIVHMGLVARCVEQELKARMAAMRRVRDAFEDGLRFLVPECEINAVSSDGSVPRLPNTSSVFIPGVRADDLVVALDLEGILVSAGAACSSGKPEPSHVLIAMKQSPERVKATVRVSFRADQEVSAAEVVAQAIARVVERVRKKG